MMAERGPPYQTPIAILGVVAMEVVDGRRVSGGHKTHLAECVPTDRYGRYPTVYRLERSVGASTQAWIARKGEGEPL